MSDIIRHCPDCGHDRSLEQHHRVAGICPDTDDEFCPEWYCRMCGAALLIGDVPVHLEPVSSGAIRDRVA